MMYMFEEAVYINKDDTNVIFVDRIQVPYPEYGRGGWSADVSPWMVRDYSARMVNATDRRGRRVARALAAGAVGLTAGLWAGTVLAAQAAAQGSAQGTTSRQVPAPAADRGRLLYETHCIACHTTQMHWRDQRVVQDWASLLGQVGAWQARAKLGWNDADIRAVATHLNASIYRLPDAPVRGE